MFDRIWSNFLTWPFEAIQRFEDLWFPYCELQDDRNSHNSVILAFLRNSAGPDSGSWTCFRLTESPGGMVARHVLWAFQAFNTHKHTMKTPFWPCCVQGVCYEVWSPNATKSPTPGRQNSKKPHITSSATGITGVATAKMDRTVRASKRHCKLKKFWISLLVSNTACI